MPDNKHLLADYTHEFDSPFLSTELFERDPEHEWEPRAAALASESPFQSAFAQEDRERFDSPETEEPGSFDEAPFSEGEAGVIKGEDRKRVTPTVGVPWRWICKIELKDNKGRKVGSGTGVLVSDSHVLTAAHVVYEATQNKQLVSIRVIPALDHGVEPFGSSSVSAIPRLPRNYSPDAANSLDWDYALLKLNIPLGKKTFPQLKGKALCFWGSPQCGANSVFARPDPATLNGRDVFTAGYPGSSGADKLMYAAGLLHSVDRLRRTMYMTADATEGQSGSPVWIVENGRYCLVGIAVDAGTNSNQVVRVTRELIRQLRTWITEDGETPSMVETEEESESPAVALPYSEAEHYAPPSSGWSPEPSTADAEDSTDTVYEEEQLELLQEQPLEERDDPPPMPKEAVDTFAGLALKLAIEAGERDLNKLTNIVFFARHPKLANTVLDPTDPNTKRLRDEWGAISRNEVWKAVQAFAENTELVVSGKEAAEQHPYFRGKNGKRLKKLVEEVAREVDINPGLMAMTMIVESHGKPHIFLLRDKVESYHIGADDFYEASGAIAKKVPAYAKVGWDRNQTPVVHDNDSKACTMKAAALAAGDTVAFGKYSKLCRQVKTIFLDSGRDAALAAAAYLKYYETVVREDVAKLNGEFDDLPIEIRLGLTRMAMHTGRGGVAPRIREAVAGKDIFIRRSIPVKIHQVQRNATVRVAQAMYLSDWVFGKPLKGAATQPELETYEGFDEHEFRDEEFEDDAEATYKDIDL